MRRNSDKDTFFLFRAHSENSIKDNKDREEKKTMNVFYFNTGVRPSSGAPLYGCQVWRNGTKQIPFSCDAPSNAKFIKACDDPNLPESLHENIIVREIAEEKGGLLSKYAYFYVPKEQNNEKI